MAACFDKNSGAAVRFLKNQSGGRERSAEAEPAGPPLTQARSQTSPVLLQFPLCRDNKPKKNQSNQSKIIVSDLGNKNTTSEGAEKTPQLGPLLVISL